MSAMLSMASGDRYTEAYVSTQQLMNLNKRKFPTLQIIDAANNVKAAALLSVNAIIEVVACNCRRLLQIVAQYLKIKRNRFEDYFNYF